MSTKTVQTQDQSYKFNPAALATYESLQGAAGKTIADFMNDPLQSGMYNQLLRSAQEGIGGRTQTAISNLTNPAFGANVSNPSAFFADQLRRTALGGQRMQSDSMTNLLTQFAGLRLGAAGQAAGYRPLQTGGSATSTQTQSGLGTWLPQLAGAAVGTGMTAATGGFGGGGFAKMFGGGGSPAAGRTNYSFSGFNTPWGNLGTDIAGPRSY